MTAAERAAARSLEGPAFYATAARGWRQWWTVLHPPYTAWHLSYVVIGACLAPRPQLSVLLATLLAFFLAVGVAAHALDELNGRPLATSLPGSALVASGILGLGGALAVGAVGVTRVGAGLIGFMIVGAVLVLGYDLELAGGRLHTHAGFAASWGAFPVLASYFAQAHHLDLVAVAAALAAFALSWAQRTLSIPARLLRRKADDASARVVLADASEVQLDRADLLAPLEVALKALSVATVALAVALAVARLGS